MRFNDLIAKKRAGEELTEDEIEFFIDGYVRGEIPDYQVSAFLMAVIFKGMTKNETFWLTDKMLHSGETIDLSSIEGKKVDKHSTGGVGDKTSLVLGPLVASCGAKFAKMSGRGLGHTGGTLDKLESIPGFNISLGREEFIEQVRRIGISIIGQTGELVPADKKLYALRDVTNTVDSIPLIASSIMSKKLAAGTDTILLDVKFGDGAFMKTMEDARKLAKLMVEIGKHFGKDTRAEITAMDEPLGYAVGNNLEVKEVVNTLLNKGPKDLTEICLHSGSTMLLQAKLVSTFEEGMEMLRKNLENGAAYKVFLDFIKAQEGDVSYIENLDKFPVALYREKVNAPRSGYIARCKALTIGLAAMKLGGGREKKEDTIDMSAGIVLKHKIGDRVEKGEELATLYTERPNFEAVAKEVLGAFEIVDDPVEKSPLILETIE
ncbi:MAG TPA: pyrimidine-nucleoside phosphorylase [Firmicutes bacterium]|nr:pyrimidine-nucleoside phosphorylase [Bacillota bacterium]